MTMHQVLTEISDFEERIDVMQKALTEQISTEGKDLLNKAFKNFFDATPEVTKVLWTQYTPYFNDGDECRFSLHDFWYYTPFDSIDHDGDGGGAFCEPYDYDKGTLASSYARPYIKEYDDALAAVGAERHKDIVDNIKGLKSVFSKVSDKVFKASFGDHVTVTATAKGFDVEEYEHG